MKKVLPSIIFLLLLALLFFAGSFMNCVSVGESRSCWSGAGIIESPYCLNNTSCHASLEDQRYNAYIETMLGGCEKAAQNGYDNEALNKAIEDTALLLYNQTLDAKTLCDNSAAYFIFREY